jgi:hypothetical protein
MYSTNKSMVGEQEWAWSFNTEGQSVKVLELVALEHSASASYNISSSSASTEVLAAKELVSR